MNFIQITDKKLNFEDIIDKVSSPTCGAISSFLGTTRNNFEGKTVTRLEYEAYIPMAEKKMAEVCNQIRGEWEVEHIAIVHRIGLVPVKEASVIIAVSSAHRKDSLEAVSFGIDMLKSTVPVWKKEFYEEGEPTWKENCECKWKVS